MNTKINTLLKSKSVKDFIKSRRFWRSMAGILIGALAGYLYFHFVGCNSGSCAITSSPYGSIITGSLFGFLIAG